VTSYIPSTERALEVSAVDGEDDVGGLNDRRHGAALSDAELVNPQV